MSAVAPLAEREQGEALQGQRDSTGLYPGLFIPALPSMGCCHLCSEPVAFGVSTLGRIFWNGMEWYGRDATVTTISTTATNRKGACSHHITRFFKTCFPHDKRLFLFERWN